MIVEVRFDASRARRWMLRAVRMLAEKADLQVRWAEPADRKPAGLELLFELERLLLLRGKAGGAAPVSRDEVGRCLAVKAEPDLVVDFSSHAPGSGQVSGRILTPLYNGVGGENAILAALLSGGLPRIEIVDGTGAVVASGLPSSENASGLSGALDTVMARTLTLLAAALAGRTSEAGSPMQAGVGRPRSPAVHVLSGVASGLAREIYRLCCHAPHWQVGWRFVDGNDDVWQRGDLAGGPWKVIPDPGVAFYADPFPVSWQGRSLVFVEELDHRVGKGFISAIEFGPEGPLGRARPVLEESWHLSYPFMIEHAGELWMIPESMANRDVAIYRCVEFPHRWERRATLLSGLELSDATITLHNGTYYLFGVLWDGAGGYSDTLAIFHAPDLFGPWRPHARNPVLVDRSTARPAGNFVTRSGRLWRPIQDCAHGYGCGLVLAEVVELSPTSFRQRADTFLKPGGHWPGRKLHTLNRAGRLEVIDGGRIQPKFLNFANRT